MHRKVDQISIHLGIALFHLRLEQNQDGDPNRRSGGRSLAQSEGGTQQHDVNLMQSLSIPTVGLFP